MFAFDILLFKYLILKKIELAKDIFLPEKELKSTKGSQISNILKYKFMDCIVNIWTTFETVGKLMTVNMKVIWKNVKPLSC